MNLCDLCKHKDTPAYVYPCNDCKAGLAEGVQLIAPDKAKTLVGLLKEARRIILASPYHRSLNKDWCQRTADFQKKL